MEVAKTILSQLGGNKFIAMTGAKHFLGDKDSLTFRLPSRFAKDGINVVKVTLHPSDCYNITFSKMWGHKINVISIVEGVYADSLQEVFKNHTGLDTHL